MPRGDNELVQVNQVIGVQMGEQQGIYVGTASACLDQPLRNTGPDIHQEAFARTFNQRARSVTPGADDRTAGSQQGCLE